MWDFKNTNLCVFTMKEYMTLYAGMVFYVRMRILNPAQVVVKSDPLNNWVHPQSVVTYELFSNFVLSPS